MQLTKAQHDHFWEKGWLVVNGVFPRDRARRPPSTPWNSARRRSTRPRAPTSVDRSADGKEAQPRKLDHAPSSATLPSSGG